MVTNNPSSSGLDEAKQELAGDAQRLKDQAASRVKEEASTRKEQVAGTAKATSSALEKAARELREDDQAPDWLASGMEQVAKSVAEFANSLKTKDVGALRRDVSGFARQNPTAFLAACGAAGFAAARFFRAGAEEKGLVSDGGSHSSEGTAYRSYGAGSAGSSYSPSAGSTYGSAGTTGGSSYGASSTGGIGTDPLDTSTSRTSGGSTTGGAL